ncbi:hypothetical protein EDC04DRAFT_2606196 [Pisolithus marmoratus]|nr:hypothetical protein EDC04DRAFT_2606196 [Pisolithus marmoratus]
MSMGDPPRYLKVPLLFEASVKGSPRLNGSLPKLLHTSLEDYHTEDSLVYEEVFLDFGTDKKLRQWNQQAIHSEINCGDLFAGKDKAGGDVAMEVEDFMKCIFTPPLDKVVYASTLFMLTCGHLVAFNKSYTTMKQAIIRLRPKYTIMFTAPDFISTIAKTFVMTYSIQVLIQGHDLFTVFQDLLNVYWLRGPHLVRDPVHLMPLNPLQSVGTDIHGTTVIGTHGARLCLWDAQRAAPFIRGPNRNMQKADIFGSRQTEKISSIIDIRLLSTNCIAKKLGAKVLSAASVFWEIEMFHPIEPSTIPQNMLVCESIHLFPQDPRGFHYWISRALVSERRGLQSHLLLLRSVNQTTMLNVLQSSGGQQPLSVVPTANWTCTTPSMHCMRALHPQGLTAYSQACSKSIQLWTVEDDRGETATFECSRTDPYPDAEKVIVHLFERISHSLDLGTESVLGTEVMVSVEEVTAISLECGHWQQHVDSVGSADPSLSIIHRHINFHVLVMPQPLDPTDTPLKQLLSSVLSTTNSVKGWSRFDSATLHNHRFLLGACDCIERDMEACHKFIDPTVNDALESPLAPQQMDAPKHGCEESLSVAGSARRPTVLNYLWRSLADKREGHVPRRDSNAEPVYSSIEPQVLENGTTKMEAECLCYC